MTCPLEGKVCLVTGATRGIGKGIALQLGEAGATVYITGRTLKSPVEGIPGSLEDTSREIEARGGNCIPIQCDHSKDDDIKSLFDRINREQDGQLDVLVNNAYAAVGAIVENVGKRFYEQDTEMWDVVNGVGLRNHYMCTVYACRLMVPRRQGLIINISSPGGLIHFLNVPYGVGKCALDRLAADVAVETRKHGIASISLWPGFVQTELVFVKLGSSHRAMPSTLFGIKMDDEKALKLFQNHGESVEASGKCVVYLAKDPNIMKKTGRILLTGDLADEYGFTDIDGKKLNSIRRVSSLLKFAGWERLGSWVPGWIKIPRSVLWLVGNRL